MGMCANSLRLGCDCLGYITYLDAHLCDSRGGSLTIPNAICMHEEDYGILWKHTDRRLPNSPDVRRSRRWLYLPSPPSKTTSTASSGTSTRTAISSSKSKLTGILSLATVHEGERPIHGTLIAPLLYAPNHQHFFNVRLDVGVDGRIIQCNNWMQFANSHRRLQHQGAREEVLMVRRVKQRRNQCAVNWAFAFVDRCKRENAGELDFELDIAVLVEVPEEAVLVVFDGGDGRYNQAAGAAHVGRIRESTIGVFPENAVIFSCMQMALGMVRLPPRLVAEMCVQIGDVSQAVAA